MTKRDEQRSDARRRLIAIVTLVMALVVAGSPSSGTASAAAGNFDFPLDASYGRTVALNTVEFNPSPGLARLVPAQNGCLIDIDVLGREYRRYTPAGVDPNTCGTPDYEQAPTTLTLTNLPLDVYRFVNIGATPGWTLDTNQSLVGDGECLVWRVGGVDAARYAPAGVPATDCGLQITVSTVDNADNVGSFTSVAIGTNGNPVVSYHDNTNGDLKVAACGNLPCTAASLATVDSVGDVGWYTSIAIGTDGNPIISYYDNGNGDLKVAACTNPSCTNPATITTLDSTGNVGIDTSIAIGTDGNPVISYYLGVSGDLKVAACTNPACTAATVSTVDSAGDVGSDNSIAIGTDGNPVISYYDSTGDDLKVAACSDPACSSPATITTVDAAGNTGIDTSIAIGTDGNPVISYWDSSTLRLRVAACTTPTCATATLTTVDADNAGGLYTSIAIGTDGNPVVAYFDLARSNLRLARCLVADCTTAAIDEVDTPGSVGVFTSTAVAGDGTIVISYRTTSFLDLKLATVAL